MKPHTVTVIGPDGKPTTRRAEQRTVPGRALLGETHFPVGELLPIPHADEGVMELPAESLVRWRMYRFRTARRGR